MFAFFTSYASPDGQVGQHEFSKCLTRLRQLVGNKTGYNEKQLSFHDVGTLKKTDDWVPALANAVRTSRVAVCFVSPRYLKSIWCGRELTVFLQRLKARGQMTQAGPGRFLFLIQWEALLGRNRPLPVRRHLFNDENLPAEYAGGLRQLINLFPQSAETVLELLSNAIRDAVEQATPLPDGDPIADFGDVANAFIDEPRAYDCWLTVVAKGGAAWHPSGAIDPIERIVERRATMANSEIRTLNPDAEWPAAAEKATADHQVVVVVIDATTTTTDPRLAQIDSAANADFVVAVVDERAAQAATALATWLSMFPTGAIARAWSDQRVRRCAPDDLPLTVDLLLTSRLQQLRTLDQAKPAVSADLTRDAVAAGVPIATRAVLVGPGGGGLP